MQDVVAGMDIGGTNIIFGLVDRSGNVLAEHRIKTAEYQDFRKFITASSSSIDKMMEGKKEMRLAALGIGAPNANYHKGTIELAPNLPWK